ncbi:2-hydroxycarboxylate transporter family protein [Cupriavidus metallidurans]|jgi:CCS family citrate carrier protein|uniref:2-hydroxycarboxylate transporter family protein n=1 Tax=Cupriavidus metallidurans TaxID=119219 RepID=UPI0007639952|nr:2-hydroxycarboxylate transporter family protein [Cupriavidus metallidurans]KWW35017.1 Citrate/malate transporter [Cupriavidus metallidurans]
MEAEPVVTQPNEAPQNARFWPHGWWRLMEIRIGIFPLPVYILAAALLAVLISIHKLANEISLVIVLFAFCGFTLAEIGKRIPLIRAIGAAAIFATFVPSALVYYKLLPEQVVKVTADFTKATNFLYLFIACIIVGSILGMDRHVLIKGFLKIFVPLAAGSIAAGAVGTLVGTALGLGTSHTFFYIVVPIMAGGVGEGAIPLSIGYSEILHQDQGLLFATVLPPVMLGSLTAIILSGTLNYLGKRYPAYTGEGRLQPGEHDELDVNQKEITGHVDVDHIAAAGVTALTLYVVGIMCHRLFGLPAPVAMLFIAVLLKLTQAVSPPLQEGAFVVYKFFSTAVTYPLLFAIGVSLTPWDKLIAAFNLPTIITIVATVATLMAVGALVGTWMKMYPIDTAIVTACHSGQGGTGDVAILTAANRMTLMPFAQIATRIGGAVTVTVVLLVLARMQ